VAWSETCLPSAHEPSSHIVPATTSCHDFYHTETTLPVPSSWRIQAAIIIYSTYNVPGVLHPALIPIKTLSNRVRKRPQPHPRYGLRPEEREQPARRIKAAVLIEQHYWWVWPRLLREINQCQHDYSLPPWDLGSKIARYTGRSPS